jgi:MFS family permease
LFGIHFKDYFNGLLGATMLVGGLCGAVIIPPFSDKQHKRKKFLLLGITLAIPGLIGLTFAATFWLLLVSAFGFGFFLISTSPIGMQYAAEITQPTPEGTSNGLIQLCGQASVIFVYIMQALESGDGSFTASLLLAIALLILSALIIMRLRDPATVAAASGLGASV